MALFSSKQKNNNSSNRIDRVAIARCFLRSKAWKQRRIEAKDWVLRLLLTENKMKSLSDAESIYEREMWFGALEFLRWDGASERFMDDSIFRTWWRGLWEDDDVGLVENVRIGLKCDKGHYLRSKWEWIVSDSAILSEWNLDCFSLT